ncbi:MAG: hypothetical protein M1828_006705 [Chrysothrix sp. TS-e1954]|nr:MAG: hypothetical protein M1828_006705 [Chrysothrix sp. TS-e1954]
MPAANNYDAARESTSIGSSGSTRSISECEDGSGAQINIFDIRRPRHEESLLQEIFNGLKPVGGSEKSLPTLLLYDAEGLKLFEEITYLEEYYLTNAEIQVFNLRKVDILLEAIDRLGKDVSYYALDLSESELQRTLQQAPRDKYQHISYFGLHGTYDDGLDWLQTAQNEGKTKVILSLGSSIGNFGRADAASFLKGFGDALGPCDSLLVGIDSCKDAKRVWHAYNDRKNVTQRFYMNGLRHANRVLGTDAFKLDEWKAVGEFSREKGCHHAYVTPLRDTQVAGANIRAGEKVWLEESYKYSHRELMQLWNLSGIQARKSWTNDRSDYAMHLLDKPTFAFSAFPEQYAAAPVPTWAEWQQLWKLWDAVTRTMVPNEELMEKPIKLRNACIFYLGHIPAFFDIKMAESTDGTLTEPKQYAKTFERGIDPDVENPEKCHAHSEVPDTWPPLNDMLAYQERIRARVKAFYDSGAISDRKIQRCLWLGYEHEGMHLETLLYMLIQGEKTLPPPSLVKPDFAKLAHDAAAASVPNDWISIPQQDLLVNMNDSESVSGPDRYFGWDIEKPSRAVHVKQFTAKARPITNFEYAQFLLGTGREDIPASWSLVDPFREATTNGHGAVKGHKSVNDYESVNGHNAANGSADVKEHNDVFADFIANKAVRTVYGGVPLSQALHWPVAASYDELARCASFYGGRIPTLEETRSIYLYAEHSKASKATNALGRTIPAVNSHLVNEGVEESPPQDGVSNGLQQHKPEPNDLFVDLDGCNVGFQNWHPIPVTQKGGKLCGQADFGGLWEWTSSKLQKHEGYEPMPLYPAYSQDFFDDRHNVVFGGSWATVPRIAGRKSFVNWYQHNYPYVWAGARLVKDT